MKKLIKSRRGVAIELAIGVMFLMIAFTIMLLSTAGLQNDHRVDDYRDFKESTEINNIGEHVLGEPTKYKTGNYEKIEINNDYSVKYTSTESKYEIYRGTDFENPDNLELVLTIEMDGNKITSWK
ncbi:MAG: hypothetical protein IJW93_05815 [Clostridia bacterium]|nr:hypothetical protein [Clostridia bacterium]